MNTTPLVPADSQLNSGFKAAGLPTPDLTLVERAKAGDQQAFAELFDLHKRRVYAVCMRMTGNAAEAEDLTQDAFIQVFRKLETFRGDSAFSTWLYRVAVNTVLMKLRSQQHMREVSLDEPLQTEDSSLQREVSREDLSLLGTANRISLERAIQDLPEGCRTVFLLHEVEGYEHHEIAQMLHCSAGNSKSQLHKARLKMRHALLRQALNAGATQMKAKRRRKRRFNPAILSSRQLSGISHYGVPAF
jgi:RNA polymerase sigma-70 factor (ECF subfamily)